MKQHERGQVLHAKFSHDWWRGRVGIKTPQSHKFHKNCCFHINFLPPSATLCTNDAKIWHETVYCRHTLTCQIWAQSVTGGLYRCPQISTFCQIWSFSVFYHQSAGQTCKKLMWRYLLLPVFYTARSTDDTLTYNRVGVTRNPRKFTLNSKSQHLFIIYKNYNNRLMAFDPGQTG